MFHIQVDVLPGILGDWTNASDHSWGDARPPGDLTKALSRKDEVAVAVPLFELSGGRSVGREGIRAVAFQMGVVYVSSSSLSICSQDVEEVLEIRSRRRPHGARRQHD